MDSNDKYIAVTDEDIIKNKKRGDILYYSVSQVATLLDQEDSSIRYYTNVFDNILKIEISDKELRYTNRDVDKLEFLINLKNKGMTIKEVQKYCEELPLDIEDLVEIKESNSISVKEIMTTIVTSENEKIDNLKEYLTNKIDESNELSVQKIVKLISEEQNKQLQFFRDGILTEIKEYIDSKFDIENKINTDLYNEFSLKMNNLITEKLSLEDNIKSQLDKFNEISISRDRNLIAEIKRFENVIERAYYVQQEMDTQKEKISFIGRLFGTR
jgi:DNA-binding transcriptional MerR regulator